MDYVERQKAMSCVRGLTNVGYENIRNLPAADVRPVVRGKWIQDCDYHFRCSACGDRWTVSNGNPLDVSNGWNFCPNCGADMRPEPPREKA